MPAEGFELVVFDFDGTLIDSTAAIVDAMCLSAADLGLPVPTRERASHVIGMGLLEAIHYAVPTIDRGRLPAFIERYRVHYLARDAQLRAFPGIDELLEDLFAAGVLLAVATGKSRVGLDRSLGQMRWRSLFADTRCADEGAPKPDPWMLRDLCETLGVAPSRAVMIGDTTHDLDMAHALGTPSVALTYGAHPRDELASRQPAALLDDVAALRAWLWPRVRALRDELEPARAWHPVCSSERLTEAGEGHRFGIPGAAGTSAAPAFVVRHQGQPRAYLNRCAHQSVELDFPAGRFFDETGLYLVCATHGAMYRPADGSCAGGPCRGRGLVALRARELNGKVWVAYETHHG